MPVALEPLALLAGSVSVSCHERLDAATLDAILSAGHFDDRWTAHVAALVEEAPLAMLARAVAAYPPAQRGQVIAGMQALGRAVGSDRIERWMTG